MSAESHSSIVSIGELLWDHLPGGRTLGGAPANVAYHLMRLGYDAVLATRVGRDADGVAARAELAALGFDMGAVQTDDDLPTGAAHVVLDAERQATYRFVTPAAFDAIEPLGVLPDAVVFGTLAQRDPRAARTIRALAAASRIAVYDVNLRPPFTSADAVRASLPLATIVKLNAEESAVLCADLDLPSGERAFATALAARYGTRAVAITRGAAGACLLADGEWHEVPGVRTPVVDTVGAGDAFAAALLAGWLERLRPAVILERANRLGAYVAGQRGAMPRYDRTALAVD